MPKPSDVVAYKPKISELRKLIGNPDVYAVQNENGSWFPIREPLTSKVLAQHRRGVITVGTYVVNPPDQARTLVFDIDAKDEAQQDADLKAVTQVLRDLRLPYLLEWSGRKGYHVWILATEYTDASTLYRLGRGVRTEAQLPNLEVFPKQTEARDLGNLLKLPGGRHAVTGQENNCFTRMPEPVEPERLAELAEQYPEVHATHARDYEAGIEYPCVATLQEGVPEGSRNIHLFHLATFMRKFSIGDDNVETIVRRANDKCDPPLEENELQTILENSKYSGPTCSQLSDEVHCGEQCIKERHKGLYTRRGAVMHAADGEEVVVQVESRGERSIELRHPDLTQARGVLVDTPKGKRNAK